MSFILRRLAFYLVAAWVAITLNFFIPRAVPGNPADIILSKYPDLTASAYKAIAQMIGGAEAQGSVWSQYVHYLNNVFHFNFGVDLANYPTPVSQLLDQSIPWTLTLVGTATVIAFAIGTILGILAGWRHGGFLDRSLPVMMFFQAAPYFFLALLLADFFALQHHWLPAGQGFNGAVTTPGWTWSFISNAVEHSLLPAFTIVLTSVAGWMLQMRNVMITTISEDYVVAAQAKGLSKTRTIYTYAARNALLPQLQAFGLALGFVVSGALIMEIVFSYPGIGLLLLNAVQSKDFPLMQAIFLVITFAVLVANLVVDMIIVFFDPRARAREAV
ncbi:MAG TPA: ABC transporter permease [Trebonia sp.]|jgi:peptide/nickel transport system permease protein|nr:ABC transporter permease [Trebonia sp.]